jgi:hypothetical protein
VLTLHLTSSQGDIALLSILCSCRWRFENNGRLQRSHIISSFFPLLPLASMLDRSHSSAGPTNAKEMPSNGFPFPQPFILWSSVSQCMLGPLYNFSVLGNVD